MSKQLLSALQGVEQRFWSYVVEASAKSQDASVLSWFALYDELDFTPSEILRALIKTQRLHRKTPITSVRRAITNLTKCGWLEKLSKMRKGPAGKPEHVWRFKHCDPNSNSN